MRSRHVILWDSKQWLGDDKVLAMEWDARAMHHHLLMLSVQQEPVGSIPNDTSLLRRWLGSPSDDIWRRVWSQISSAWELRGDRRFNSGMVKAAEERKKYLTRNESKNNPKTAETLCDYSLPDWVPKEPWESFVESRTKLRRPLTQRAAALIWMALGKLKAQGQDPGEVLNQSIRRGWLDVFPLESYRRGEVRIRPPEGVVQPRTATRELGWDDWDDEERLRMARIFLGTKRTIPEHMKPYVAALEQQKKQLLEVEDGK